MKPVWLRILPYIAAVLLVLGALYGTYRHGMSVKDDEWTGRWNDRNTLDAKARAANEAAERAKEQARQLSMNKAIQDGQRTIDQLMSDAAAERASRSGLQLAADNLSARLAASEAGGNSCTAAASKTAARYAAVLADVFKRADQRAGDLAEVADQARARGMTCERSYSALSSGH